MNFQRRQHANHGQGDKTRMARTLSRTICLPYLFLVSLISLLVAMLVLMVSQASAVCLKDIASIKGVRSNQLVGYGLVVGLDGTGDGNKATFTTKPVVSMLEKTGVTVNAEDIKVKNVAAVMVTADLPPFAKGGTRIDAIVSSIGDVVNALNALGVSPRDPIAIFQAITAAGALQADLEVI